MTTQRIKTGDISARIGLTVTADLITSLGFPPDETQKRAKLWDESKYPKICQAIADHVAGKSNSTAMAPSKTKPAEDDDEL